MYLIQNNNNTTRTVTESYEEWEIMIQKLKERDSYLSEVDRISELDKDPSKKEKEQNQA